MDEIYEGLFSGGKVRRKQSKTDKWIKLQWEVEEE